ncbi:MAG TPA: hypothetical protein P5121_19020 [Caldilineaceae bacterium]|nr:hypothetical protein [Caldilineaceae bacterium]
MTAEPVRFPYQPGGDIRNDSALPYLQLRLQHQQRVVDRLGLVDSGATVNVLPYSVGLQLGAIWEQQRVEIALAGNLAAVPARGLLLSATYCATCACPFGVRLGLLRRSAARAWANEFLSGV